MTNFTELHHHFINQTKCPPAVSGTFTAFLLIASVFSLAGNLLVIIAFIKTPTLKSRTNYYIVNMAVSDLVSVFFTWPLFATEGMLKADGSLITDIEVSVFFCKLGIYSRAVSYVVSVASLVLIAVDRFTAIAFPLKAVDITRRIRAFFLPLSWGVPLLVQIPFFIYSKIVKTERHTFCRTVAKSSMLQIYSLVGFCLVYCMPLTVIFVLYPLIVRRLKKQAQFNISHNRQRILQLKIKRIRQNQNIVKMFKSIVFGFFICWTPMYVYMFLKSLYPSIFDKDRCLVMVGLFYYFCPLLSTAVNPFILVAFSSHFRAAARNLCTFSLFRKLLFCFPLIRVSPKENIALPALKWCYHSYFISKARPDICTESSHKCKSTNLFVKELYFSCKLGDELNILRSWIYLIMFLSWRTRRYWQMLLAHPLRSFNQMLLTEPEDTQHLQLQLLWAKHQFFGTHQLPKMLSWRFENIRGRLSKQSLTVV